MVVGGDLLDHRGRATAAKTHRRHLRPGGAARRLSGEHGPAAAAKIAGRNGARSAGIARRPSRRITKGAFWRAGGRPASPGAPGAGSRRWPSAGQCRGGSGTARADVALRARIAERLVQSQSTYAILTTFNEVNMQAPGAASAPP